LGVDDVDDVGEDSVVLDEYEEDGGMSHLTYVDHVCDSDEEQE